jgi:hypothetical protein
MTIQYPHDSDPRCFIAQARALADDLARIVAGDGPTDADLADAPLIDLWRPALRPVFALIGVVHGHPSVRAGHTALTSDAGWARSWSRFYALGRCIGGAGRRQ